VFAIGSPALTVCLCHSGLLAFAGNRRTNEVVNGSLYVLELCVCAE
jgi:hypothetical protein